MGLVSGKGGDYTLYVDIPENKNKVINDFNYIKDANKHNCKYLYFDVKVSYYTTHISHRNTIFFYKRNKHSLYYNMYIYEPNGTAYISEGVKKYSTALLKYLKSEGLKINYMIPERINNNDVGFQSYKSVDKGVGLCVMVNYF